jgi:hypothetical protein
MKTIYNYNEWYFETIDLQQYVSLWTGYASDLQMQ